eukprot:TRINITY_DN12300_c0_g1_i1.p1 TRINITY_DN12300_c0_g1~~TRINITY_DN12300_c0_g1_i1.p1  ORF type:complete len:276 (-),score=48.60 TRINITY_DN12300_c0_g1_i1:50-832(-)
MDLVVSVFQIPKAGKINPLGEDSYFLSEDEQVFGVYDGVGGWGVEHGIDAKAYSEKLAQGTEDAYQAKGKLEPLKLMEAAYQYSKKVKGTSTACVACLSGNKVSVANCGDSALLVLRGHKMVFRTQDQQVEFNMPYQIGTGSDITPKCHAIKSHFLLADKDWIIIGSDGLFDNLSDLDIDKVLKKVSSPSHAAKVLAKRAFKVSGSQHSTPFERGALRHGISWRGGKPDDITVIALYVDKANADDEGGKKKKEKRKRRSS